MFICHNNQGVALVRRITKKGLRVHITMFVCAPCGRQAVDMNGLRLGPNETNLEILRRTDQGERRINRKVPDMRTSCVLSLPLPLASLVLVVASVLPSQAGGPRSCSRDIETVFVCHAV